MTQSMPISASTWQRNSVHQEQLDTIADGFLEDWKRAHGLTGRSADAQLKGSVLIITIEDALTAAEMKLADRPQGYLAMRNYLRQLIAQIYVDLAHRIEDALRCSVGASHVDLHPQRNAVIFTIEVH
ncbi:MAG: Na-translocating system protein MpsC family protein [Caldilineaceae bacterium]|nr:DUF2294 family protein [Caldilineaceae bacterium]